MSFTHWLQLAGITIQAGCLVKTILVARKVKTRLNEERELLAIMEAKARDLEAVRVCVDAEIRVLREMQRDSMAKGEWVFLQ